MQAIKGQFSNADVMTSNVKRKKKILPTLLRVVFSFIYIYIYVCVCVCVCVCLGRVAQSV